MAVARTPLVKHLLTAHLAASLGRHRLTPQSIYGAEQFGQTYNPVRDNLLSQALGLGVSVYNRSPGHMALGYADRAQRNVDLSQPAYQQLYALKTLGGSAINRRSARAAFELAHEMGHVHVGPGEEQASLWANHHFGSILKRFGLNRAARQHLMQLASDQHLLSYR